MRVDGSFNQSSSWNFHGSDEFYFHASRGASTTAMEAPVYFHTSSLHLLQHKKQQRVRSGLRKQSTCRTRSQPIGFPVTLVGRAPQIRR